MTTPHIMPHLPIALFSPILPNAILGILGGGQLGKMFCAAAQRMGYRVWVLDPDPQCPTAVIADHHVCAAFNDETALAHFRAHCEAVTTEFENVPASTLAFLATDIPVCPSAEAVSIVQHRWKEKTFLQQQGFPTTPFHLISSEHDLTTAPEIVFPGILKTCQLGYDGKGQCTVQSKNDLDQAWKNLNFAPCLLEKRLDLDLEISVMVARDWNHQTSSWPVAENIHHNGILDTTIVPARIPEHIAHQAQALAIQVANTLNYVGILGVEFFIVKNALYINELAPRPHNSGHYTIEASLTSQFEQQVRVLCQLPLGETTLLSPVAMLNLLGDVWLPKELPQELPYSPNWAEVLARPGAKLHLYGKHIPLSQRKMGHISCLSSSVEQALEQLELIRKSLGIPSLEP